MNQEYNIVGLTVEEAENVVAEHGITEVRATMIDGSHLMCTSDYRTDRINVGVSNGKIISVGGLG